MVLEHFYGNEWIHKKNRYAFIMGFLYSVIAIVLSSVIFNNFALASIFIAVIMITNSLNKLLSKEEVKIEDEPNFKLSTLYKEHKDIFELHIFLFLGIFSAFAFFTLIWPKLATNPFFLEKIALQDVEIFSYSFGFISNLKLFLVGIILSFFYGAGGIFLITLSAAVWGTALGVIIKSSFFAIVNPFTYLITLLAVLLPYFIFETMSFISAAIAGGILSKGAHNHHIISTKFKKMVIDAVIMFSFSVLLLLLSLLINNTVTSWLKSVLL